MHTCGTCYCNIAGRSPQQPLIVGTCLDTFYFRAVTAGLKLSSPSILWKPVGSEDTGFHPRRPDSVSDLLVPQWCLFPAGQGPAWRDSPVFWLFLLSVRSHVFSTQTDWCRSSCVSLCPKSWNIWEWIVLWQVLSSALKTTVKVLQFPVPHPHTQHLYPF